MTTHSHPQAPSAAPRPGRRWFVLAAAFLVMAFGFALRNSFSVFYPAIVQDLGWSRGNTALMFSLSILVYGLLSPGVGGLVERLKPHLLVASGVVVLGGGFALCGFGTREWHFYLLFGGVVALGTSMIGITPLSAIVTPWFSRSRGMVFGVLAAGFGMSLVSASAAQYLISTYGWQNAYFIAGLSFVAVMVPLVLLFIRRMPGSERTRHPVTSRAEAATPGRGLAEKGWHSIEWTLGRAMRTPQFWMLWLAGFCQVGLAEKIAIAHQVYFFRDAGYTPMAAAAIYSVFGIVFVAGNLVSSVSDRIGRERVYLPACLLSIASACLLFVIRDASQPWMAYLFAVCFGFGIGVLPPILFAAVADLFHGRSYGAIQGMMVTGISAGGAISPWLSGLLFDITGSYTPMLSILVAALVACGLLVQLAAPGRLSPVPARQRN
jgi:sugar phosphate permease